MNLSEKERAGELQLRLNQLHSFMAEQQAEADIAIDEWENRHRKAEEQLDALRAQVADGQTLHVRIRELEEVESKKELALEQFGMCILATQIEAESAQKKLQDVIRENSAMESDFERRLQEVSMRLAAKESEIEKISLPNGSSSAGLDPVEERDFNEGRVCDERQKDSQEQGHDRVGVLLEENCAIKEMVDTLEASNCILTEQVGELQEELRVALHSLQSLASERAIETAVNALHAQVLSMRRPQSPVCEFLLNEQRRREDADEEVLGDRNLFEEDEIGKDFDWLCTRNQDRKATFSTGEQDQGGLSEEVTEELVIARKEVQAAKPISASSRVGVFALEEEGRVANLDIAAMEKMICVAQHSAMQTRASVGDRISRLERSSGPFCQGSCMEASTLTAELVQLSTEKERLLHLLNKRENGDSSLAVSVVLAECAHGVKTKCAQVEQLSLEKKQLLDALATVGQRLEHRVREIVAANASSLDLDMILVKEGSPAVKDVKSS